MGRAVRVFLSYRRGDVGGYAGRLADALHQRLGANSVFQDVVTIAPGQDFTAVIDRALDESDAVLAVIGPGWLSAANPQGDARLFETDDYVRLELARALKRGVRVIPILVGGAALPAAADLPTDLRGLVQRQAVVLHDASWHQDVDGLVRSLRGEPAVPVRKRRRWLIATAAAVVLALTGVGLGLWAMSGGNGSSGSSVDKPPPSCMPPSTTAGWTQILPLGKDPTGQETVNGDSYRFSVKEAWWRAHGNRYQVTLKTSMENQTTDSQYHYPGRYRGLIVGQKTPPDPTCFSSIDSELVNAETKGDAWVGFDVECKPEGRIQLVLEDGKTKIDVTPSTQPGPCS